MTEPSRAVLLMVRMGNKTPARKNKPGRSGLTPFRIFDTHEEADNWVDRHPVGFQTVKFEIVVKEVEQGMEMIFYDPHGGFEKWRSILTPGLYYSLRQGHPQMPGTEEN